MYRKLLGFLVLSALLGLGLSGCSDDVIVQGVEVEKGALVGGEAAEVEDLGDGTSDEGGAPDVEADLHEAAVTDEDNLGPNAPGYIP